MYAYNRWCWCMVVGLYQVCMCILVRVCMRSWAVPVCDADMCVCMYMFVYACICLHINMHIWICEHENMHTRQTCSTFLYTHIHRCVYAHMHLCVMQSTKDPALFPFLTCSLALARFLALSAAFYHATSHSFVSTRPIFNDCVVSSMIVWTRVPFCVRTESRIAAMISRLLKIQVSFAEYRLFYRALFVCVLNQESRLWLVGSLNYKSLLQNIVSFIGLFCRRDL